MKDGVKSKAWIRSELIVKSVMAKSALWKEKKWNSLQIDLLLFKFVANLSHNFTNHSTEMNKEKHNSLKMKRAFLV